MAEEEKRIVIDDGDVALAMYLSDVEQSTQQRNLRRRQSQGGSHGDIDDVILLDQSTDSVTAMDVSDEASGDCLAQGSGDSDGVIVLGEEMHRQQSAASSFSGDAGSRQWRRRMGPSLASPRARELRHGQSPVQPRSHSSRKQRNVSETEQERQDRLLAERLQQEEQDRLLSFGSGLMGADGTDGGVFGPAYGLDMEGDGSSLPRGHRRRHLGRGTMHPHPDAGQLALNLGQLGSSSSSSSSSGYSSRAGPASRTRNSGRYDHLHWPASPSRAWPASAPAFHRASSSSSSSSSSSTSSAARGRSSRRRGAGHPGGAAVGPSHWAWMDSVAGGFGGWVGGASRFGSSGMSAHTRALAEAQASLGIDFDNLPNDGSTYEQLLALDDRIEKRGLSADQRDALTATAVVTAADAKRLKERGDTCAICLDEYEDRQRTRRLPCMCTYHQQCIDTHLQQSVQCPICRVEIKSATAQ